MSLSSELARQVDASVRERGCTYFHMGVVRLRKVTDDRIEAVVHGTVPYDVTLKIQRSAAIVRIRARCSCPYFENEAICKHIWATLLQVEQRSSPGLEQASALRLIDDDLGEDEDTFGDTGDDDEAIIRLPPLLDGSGDHRYGDLRDGHLREDVDDHGFSSPSWHHLARRRRDASERRQPTWRDPLEEIQRRLLSKDRREESSGHLLEASGESRLLYVLNLNETQARDGCILRIARQLRKRDGTWGEARPCALRSYRSETCGDGLDRQISSLLLGAEVNTYGGYHHSFYDDRLNEIFLQPSILDTLLPLLCGTGRLYLGDKDPDLEQEPVRLQDGGPWQYRLKVEEDTVRGGCVLYGALERGDERLGGHCALAQGGWVFRDGEALKVNGEDFFLWRGLLDANAALHIPEKEVDALLEMLYRTPTVPPIDWPPSLRPEEMRVTPRFHVRVNEDDERRGGSKLRVELSYLYGEARVFPARENRRVLEPKTRKLYIRDLEAETLAVTRLRELGCRTPPAYVYRYDEERKQELDLVASRLPEVARTLAAEGWLVEAHGRLIRPAGQFRMNVSSGIDWFDLEAELDFGGSSAKLPDLLAAVKRGETWVRLDDGTCGVVPEEWLKKYGFLVQSGEVDDEKIRFRPYQVGLLDALLAEEPEANWDETFAQARAALRKFDGIRPKKPPRSFKGTLRPYQQEGIGWLSFLRKFRFGGCLADDMGLGKTIQALALLEARRLELRRGQRAHKPSLVVMPRSLMFNWRAEAERFAPRLRVLDQVGPGRVKEAHQLRDYDLVLTTYGTLRRDVPLLKEAEFDYVILDEAQAIKNATSASAKAARLLKADHRLALSGTPIENHLGELWSLFEFLNPGMLGTSAAFKAFSGRQQLENDAARQMLSRAIRPFLLRRTKSQVAKDLPEKTEQTIFCDLDSRQRRLYNEIRDHYRTSLLSRVEKKGLGQSRIQVLEALLRLRQVACHPALIDKERVEHSSAKLAVLLEQVSEIVEEGHKALIFSQFTSLLGLVRKKLDGMKIRYEYLDGKTRKRAERVEKFQNDPERSLFLISLKAGGSGLNLTAAEYVFLLDPWWNPAVEAQAVDRTHRIGQTRPVFAYRLIARDTVEEKVLELQKRKRDLADAIMNENSSLLRDLSREDLEMLLS